MRFPRPLPVLALTAACVSPHAEPGVVGYLHIFSTARDARQACAGLGAACASADMEGLLARAQAEAPASVLLPPERAARERGLAEAAIQAAAADCRGRGIRPGTARWESCKVDRSIDRLSELAALR